MDRTNSFSLFFFYNGAKSRTDDANTMKTFHNVQLEQMFRALLSVRSMYSSFLFAFTNYFFFLLFQDGDSGCSEFELMINLTGEQQVDAILLDGSASGKSEEPDAIIVLGDVPLKKNVSVYSRLYTIYK